VTAPTPSLRDAALMALIDAYADTAAVNGVRSPWAQMARTSVVVELRAALALPKPIERQPLTDVILDELCEKKLLSRASLRQFIRDIEAALGIGPASKQDGGR